MGYSPDKMLQGRLICYPDAHRRSQGARPGFRKDHRLDRQYGGGGLTIDRGAPDDLVREPPQSLKPHTGAILAADEGIRPSMGTH